MSFPTHFKSEQNYDFSTLHKYHIPYKNIKDMHNNGNTLNTVMNTAIIYCKH